MANDAYTSETRKRILDAAYEVFSEAGYNGASVRQIVGRAGTNIASVNYHFGNKEALYKEVVEAALSHFATDVQSIVADLGDATDPLAHIHAFAKTRIRSGIATFKSEPPRLLGWEIVNPIMGMKTLMKKKMEAAEGPLIVLLSPLFGPEATVRQKAFTARWFLTSTLPPPPVAIGLRDMLGPDPDEAAVDLAVSNLADAAVAGAKSLAASTLPG